MKCPRINENQLSIFARTAVTQIPATEARLLIPILKHRGCTVQNLDHHQQSPQARASAAFIFTILLSFVNIASTHSPSSGAFHPMIEIQPTTIAHIAENLDL
jgi:hypothetical protein